MAHMLTLDVTDVRFYEALAHEMNAHPERYAVLGDADMTVALVITGADRAPVCIQVTFAGLSCTGVDRVSPAEADLADFHLVGPVDAWEAMFTDICRDGRASGAWTINSLALIGDRLVLAGDDPMGIDKFSRFNQTLQEFFDGAGRIAAPPAPRLPLDLSGKTS